MKRALRFLIAGTAMILASVTVGAQAFEVSILDSFRSEPIEGVQVILTCDGTIQASGLTNADGVASLTVGVSNELDPFGDGAEALSAPYPNPFGRISQVAFSTDRAETVRLTLYDLLGRVVVARSEYVTPGTHAVEVDLAGLAPGTYLLQAERSGRPSEVRRLVKSEASGGAPTIRMAGAVGAFPRRPVAAASKQSAATSTCEVQAALEGYRDGTTEVTLPVEGRVEMVLKPGKDPDFVNSIGMEFIRIPKGTFLMGSPTSDFANERPVHSVTLTRDFYMGTFEVTQREWKAMGRTDPSDAPECPGEVEDNCPVERVTWTDAILFANSLSTAEGLTPCYGANGNVVGGEGGSVTRCEGYRLPTEAEWEYAARAGTTTEYSFGEDTESPRLGDYAWHGGNSGIISHPVGGKLPNAWGLHDVHGNVGEWVFDWWDLNYYSISPAEDPQGPESGTLGRGHRGCSFICPTLRVSARNGLPQTGRGRVLGFRLARTAE